jgi:hypothetical protein
MNTAPLNVGNKDQAQLAHYLIGGGAVGASAALLTSLVNHFKTLNSSAERAADTSGDDDTLYVNLKPRAKSAGQAAAIASSLVGAPVVYALIRKAYEKQKRMALQEELDQAQNSYLDTMVPGAKQAGILGLADKVFAAPAVATLLAMVGSGVLTDRILDKNFPAPKAPNSLRPRRLVLRDAPPAKVEEDEEQEKVAADAAEGLLASVLAVPESAQASGLGDLVKAAAAGRTEEILQASDEGFETMMALTKSAGVETFTELQRDLATGWLVREPELAPVVKLAAAIEFAGTFPLAMTLAREVPDEMKDDMVKFAALFRQWDRVSRHEQTTLPVVKSAYGIADALQDAISATHSTEVPEDNLTAGESSDSTGVKVEAQGVQAKELLAKKHDVIDQVLTAENPGPAKI